MITDLAESGAGDQTIMDIAGHVSKNMLKHYSHIVCYQWSRVEPFRRAIRRRIRRRYSASSLWLIWPPTASGNLAVDRTQLAAGHTIWLRNLKYVEKMHNKKRIIQVRNAACGSRDFGVQVVSHKRTKTFADAESLSAQMAILGLT
jgi:hypothetical protein